MMNVNDLISNYGYYAVFLVIGLESVGIPLPGETVLIAAATYAATSGNLNIWVIFAAAAAGAILGDNVGYWIGNKGGYKLARKYGPKIHLDERKLKVGRYMFDRHGGKVVFFGRFVSVLRTFAAFLAGTVRMSWPRFLLYNALGGLVWSAIYAFGFYAAGNTLKQLSGIVNYVAIGIAVVVVVVVFLVVRRQTNLLADKAEAAYPGPLE
ncbi:DedA family protein [Nakamurella sp. PAMC28650]|uniref:DedA family protein n=1 Tax=Nakamurella sp. PAMC28650 TaxID=2762325 RepID=UPI00164D91EF|nr:DedA family protein [Nakamurella sp. PAMC28650]QNK82195.1 DedA family protein [Nakamurella sp. PAMC28650]